MALRIDFDFDKTTDTGSLLQSLLLVVDGRRTLQGSLRRAMFQQFRPKWVADRSHVFDWLHLGFISLSASEKGGRLVPPARLLAPNGFALLRISGGGTCCVAM